MRHTHGSSWYQIASSRVESCLIDFVPGQLVESAHGSIALVVKRCRGTDVPGSYLVMVVGDDVNFELWTPRRSDRLLVDVT